MSVLFVLIPLSLLLGGVALYFFKKGVEQGQFDASHAEWTQLLEVKSTYKDEDV